MQISLYGAAGGEVTGSAYLVRTNRARVLVDCGMFQGMPGADDRNRAVRATTLKDLDAVLLTHAHLDHTGRLPLLVQRQFEGPVHCTAATAELTGLILRDAARIQAGDIERVNRRRQRAGKPAIQVLYTTHDVERVISLLRRVPYRTRVRVADGIDAIWLEAGHMLGSASIQLIVQDNGRTRTVVFSGDLGQRHAPILKDYEPFTDADAVFLECTYGDRDHRSFSHTVAELLAAVRQAVAQKGKILVPTFAIGRAQLLIALASWMFRTKKVPPFPVCLDSPMAIEASRIYAKHPELWDEETRQYVAHRRVVADLKPAGGRATVTADESRALNDLPGPCMILAGAGMCNAGRILHHLRNNLWSDRTHVLFVGYQARGTLGRALVEGATDVRIFGEPVAVRAKIHTLGGLSAHAGQTDLLHWFSSMAPSQPRVFLTHGEEPCRRAMAARIKQQSGLTAALPVERQILEI